MTRARGVCTVLLRAGPEDLEENSETGRCYKLGSSWGTLEEDVGRARRFMHVVTS